MKTSACIILSLVAGGVAAQTPVNKNIPVQAGQKISMHFDYPKLVRVSTWDKSEISIQGRVSINDGENDNAFSLLTATDNNTVSVRNEIKDLEDLPRRITVRRDGQKMTFRNNAEWRRYQEEHGKDHESMSDGVDLEITLDIKVPQNTDTRIESVYGMVEVRNFNGPLRVNATYGGVDASVVERTTGELVAETNYGHIYSNLEFKPEPGTVRDEDFHTLLSLKPGNGPHYSFESQYGNVYLRKLN